MTDKKKKLGARPVVSCPFNPSECQEKFATVLRKVAELEVKVDALPNGSKLDLILNLVEGVSTRLTSMSPQVEAMSQRVDEALRVADHSAETVVELKAWLESLSGKMVTPAELEKCKVALDKRLREIEGLVE